MFPCRPNAGRTSSRMELRPAHRREIREIATLWSHTFPDGPSLADRIRTLETAGEAGGIETVLVATDGERIAGALKSLRLTQHMGGAALPMFGVAAVAVAPWARRRGVARALCEHALRLAADRGDAVSGLYPFRPAFYGRMGWALAGELHRYRFAPEQLHDPGDTRVHLAAQSELPAVFACYDRVSRESNGLIGRDAARWKHHLEAPGTHVFVARTGRSVDGYVIVRYGRSRSPERRLLLVRELVAAEEAARVRLLGFLSRQRDLWRRIIYDAAPDENFSHRLADPRPPGYGTARSLWAESARIIRGPMFRLVDIGRAFSLRADWGPAEPFELSLVVSDPQLPDNEGAWRLAFDGQRAAIRRAPPGPAGLRVDAPALAALYAGELSVSDAVRLGQARIEGDTAANTLDAFFRPASAFRLLDEF